MIDRVPLRSKEPPVHTDADLTHTSARPGEDGADLHWVEAADTVRRALVRLRGGSPLLSPSDERLLLRWFDRGVGVASILRALEVAADRRRARRVRAPLMLSHARLLLKSSPHAPVAAETVLVRIPEVACAPAAPPAVAEALERLAAQVASLQGGPHDAHAVADQLADWALAAQDAAWRGLDDAEREGLAARAAEALADVVHLLDEGEESEVIETYARGLLRDAWPAWSVARLVDAVLA